MNIDWRAVCSKPEEHKYFQTSIDLGKFVEYWCKLCSLNHYPIKVVDKDQLEIPFED